MVHVPYVRYHNTVTSGNPGELSSTDKLPLGFPGSVIINQRGKMAENRSSLINAGPQLNAYLEKTPGQNSRILNKRRGCLIEKIR